MRVIYINNRVVFHQNVPAENMKDVWQTKKITLVTQRFSNAIHYTASESLVLTAQSDWIDSCVVNLTWTSIPTGSYAIYRSLNLFVQSTDPGVETIVTTLSTTNYQDLHNTTGTFYYMVQAHLPDGQQVNSTVQNITITTISPLALGKYEILPDHTINFSIVTRYFPSGNTSLSIDFYDHRSEPNPEHIGLQTESIPGSKGRFEGLILDLQGHDTGWNKFSIRISLTICGRIKYNFVTFSTNGSFPTYIWSNFWVETTPIIVLNTPEFSYIIFVGLILGLFALSSISLSIFYANRDKQTKISPLLKYIYLLPLGAFFISLGISDLAYGYGLDMGVWNIWSGWITGDTFSIFMSLVVAYGILLGLTGIFYWVHRKKIQKYIEKDPAHLVIPLLQDIKILYKSYLIILLSAMGYSICRIVYLLTVSLNVW